MHAQIQQNATILEMRPRSINTSSYGSILTSLITSIKI